MKNILFLALWLSLSLSAASFGQEESAVKESRKGKATAPPNHSSIRGARGGAYFIPSQLEKQLGELQAQVEQLQQNIDLKKVRSQEAIAEVAKLQAEITALLRKVEQEKVLVTAFNLFSQTDTYEFELGAEQLLVIRADQVAVQSWDGPNIRCVLEKSILAKEKPKPAEFEGIRMVHKLGPHPELVGLSPAEQELREKEFSDSPDGKKLTPKQLAGRKEFVDEIVAYRKPYRAFQGKEINVLKVEGLLFDEGNYQMSYEVFSPDGGGLSGSQWARYASLTVMVPKCRHVAVMGCLRGLQVKELATSLLVTEAESHDRDYNALFTISGVQGDVHVIDVPIQHVTKVTGNVTISATMEMRDGGNRHENNFRTAFLKPMPTTTIENVTGDLDVQYVQTDLRVENIAGRMDVFNEFGPTVVTLGDKLAESPHRIRSYSGTIAVRTPKETLQKISTQALTQVGTVRINQPRSVLEELSFSSHGRSWRGFTTPTDANDFSAHFARLERAPLAWNKGASKPGLDILTGSGTIEIDAE